MTPLAKILAARIAATGPITIADYMAECLLHPRHGYYSTRDPLGQAGDFTTAPEISQMFGELVAAWLVSAWQAAGRPTRPLFAEIGPGRGTLMADALRGTAKVSKSLTQAKLHLCETNPLLREKQKQALGNYSPRWIEDLKDLPRLPTIFIGLEILAGAYRVHLALVDQVALAEQRAAARFAAEGI